MPSPFNFRIQFSIPPEQVERIWQGLAQDLRDFTPAMVRISGVLAEMYRKIFESEGAELGSEADIGRGTVNVAGGWEKDSPEYLRRKLRQGYTAATLRMTQKLEDSLTSENGTTGSIRRISEAGSGIPRLIYGTRVAWAAALHFGSTKHRMPARPIAGITADAKTQIRAVLQSHLDERLAAAGAALSRRETV